MMKSCSAPFFVLLLSFMNALLAGEVMKLTEDDAGKTVELRVGDELEIVLPGNPTTGYVWEARPLDPAVLRQDKSGFLPGDKAIGSGGMEVIKLHMIGEGRSEIKLICYRPFERIKPPLKAFAITVVNKK